MERIEALYHETNGDCCLSFSGGKDSMVILALIRMCQEIYTIPEDAISAVYINTGIELGVTNEFVEYIQHNYYSNIKSIRPSKIHSFDKIISSYGKPLKSKMKSEFLHRWHVNKSSKALDYLLGKNNLTKIRIANKDMHMLHSDFDIIATNKCCHYLKKKPFEVYAKENGIKGYFTGVRMSEGGARQLNAEGRLKTGGSLCTSQRKGIIIKMPIIDWDNQDIDQFIKMYQLPLSNAYTVQGYERTGCFLCPYSLRLEENLYKLYLFDPLRYQAAMYWLQDVYIAQGVTLLFDNEYEIKKLKKWNECYFDMRYEMLRKYRPENAEKYLQTQLGLF